MNKMTKFLLIPVIIVFVLFLWIRFQEHYGIFYPTQATQSAASTLPPSIELVKFESTDGVAITGLWKAGQPNKPVIVLAHGNAGNMFDRMFWFKKGMPPDWNALIFDYRGYGLSEGTPDEPGIYRDAIAAADWARAQRPESPLFFHGRSLGVPAITHAATRITPDAMVLESGFPSGVDMGKTILPLPGLKYLMSVEFSVLKSLAEARQNRQFPVLVIHGKEDRIVPFELGEQLYEEIDQPKLHWWVALAGHNNLISVAGQRYQKRLHGFYQQAVEGRE